MRRPLVSHRFAIEVDLVTADDIDRASLVSTLTSLATAGLHGMVSAVRSVSLDGEQTEFTPEPAHVEKVRPPRAPSDPKLKRAIRDLDAIVAALRGIDGSSALGVVAPIPGTNERAG